LEMFSVKKDYRFVHSVRIVGTLIKVQ